MRRSLARALLLVVLVPAAAVAADKTIAMPPDDPYAGLRPGPGVETARQQCGSCHSTDYIVMQPRGSARQWEAVVTKMIKVFGAPVNDQDARTVVEYLAAQYGN